jgi:hypothetical protein
MLHSTFGDMLAYAFNMAFFLLCLFCLYTALIYKVGLLVQKCCELTVLKQISFIRDLRASLILACRIWHFKCELLTHGQGIFQLNSHFCVFLYYTCISFIQRSLNRKYVVPMCATPCLKFWKQPILIHLTLWACQNFFISTLYPEILITEVHYCIWGRLYVLCCSVVCIISVAIQHSLSEWLIRWWSDSAVKWANE